MVSTQRSSQLPQSPAQGQAAKIPASVGVVLSRPRLLTRTYWYPIAVLGKRIFFLLVYFAFDNAATSGFPVFQWITRAHTGITN